MEEVGTVIDNKYEIIELIGQGGMSEVYLVMDNHLNIPLTAKKLRKNADDKDNKVIVQSAIAEANLIKRINHPAIVRIYDIINNYDAVYIIEEYIKGETLGKILDEHGAQSQELVIEWGIQLCDALSYLHALEPAIIYRDMKPANIILTPSRNIKLIDFGIAREYKPNNIADTSALGTVGYAAPEQYGGKGQTDVRTDIYCLGVTLYHLVTGQNPCEPPYEIYPIRQWNPQLSADLERIIVKCTQRDPDSRYQNCGELMNELNHCAELREPSEGKKIFFLLKVLFANKLIRRKKKKYINNDNYKDSINLVDFDDAIYMAKIFSIIQNDERNCSTIKGPYYNE